MMMDLNTPAKHKIGENSHAPHDDHRQPVHCRLHLQGTVGSLTFTGSELVYYPELTRKLRDLRLDYPLLKRDYPLSCQDEDRRQTSYFDRAINDHMNLFFAELNAASAQVDQWIQAHGQARQIPLLYRTSSQSELFISSLIC